MSTAKATGAEDGAGSFEALDVRVVRGAPTDEELAAVLATLQAVAATAAERKPTPTPARSEWSRTTRDPRTPLPTTWR